MLSALAYRMLRDHVHLWITFVFVSINTCVSLGITKTSPEDHAMLLAFQRVLKGGGGGSQSHFPPEILAKSQSQLDFYQKSQSELLKSQSVKKRYLSVE